MRLALVVLGFAALVGHNSSERSLRSDVGVVPASSDAEEEGGDEGEGAPTRVGVVAAVRPQLRVARAAPHVVADCGKSARGISSEQHVVSRVDEVVGRVTRGTGGSQPLGSAGSSGRGGSA